MHLFLVASKNSVLFLWVEVVMVRHPQRSGALGLAAGLVFLSFVHPSDGIFNSFVQEV